MSSNWFFKLDLFSIHKKVMASVTLMILWKLATAIVGLSIGNFVLWGALHLYFNSIIVNTFLNDFDFGTRRA